MGEKVLAIALDAAAPAKPAPGEACNGCGLCCAAEPCPPAMLFFWRRRGACPALLWVEREGCYRCGLVLDPGHFLHWLPRRWHAGAARFFARRIAAGSGCDADIELVSSE